MAQWKQYSGMWTMQQQMQAQGIGNWNNAAPAVDLNQGLFVWGYNVYGDLGTNNTVPRSSPVQLNSQTYWKRNSCGNSCSALRTDGTAWAWGSNFAGNLGIGNTQDKSSPVQIGSLTTWADISTSPTTTIGVLTSGIMLTCGQNYFGQLGLGSTGGYKSSPTQVGALTTWMNGFASYQTSAAIKTNGTLWTFGLNSSGQLGQNRTATPVNSPVQVGALTTWSKVYPRPNWMLATKTDSTLWAWGNNSEGQLGQNNQTRRSSPVQIGALNTWMSISTGYLSSYGILSDGTLWAWGNNTWGQLGQNNLISRSSPVQVGALNVWKNVVGTGYSVFLQRADGTLWAMGRNSYGALGQNDLIPRSSPVQVGNLSNWYLNNTTNGGAAENEMICLLKSAA